MIVLVYILITVAAFIMASRQPEFWTQWGHVFARRGRYEKAIRAYEKALELDPNYAEALRGKGFALRKEPSFNLESTEKLNQSGGETNNQHLGNQDHNTSSTNIRKMVTIGMIASGFAVLFVTIWAVNSQAEILARTALAFAEAGKGKEALVIIDKAIELDEDSFTAWHNKGVILYIRQDVWQRDEETLAIFDRAIELDGDHGMSWIYKSYYLIRLKRYKEVVKAAEKAIELIPQHPYAWNNRGIGLAWLGKHDQAIKSYKKAIKLDPNYANAWFNIGHAHNFLGKRKEAIKYYKKALAINPNHSGALKGKAVAMRKKDQQETMADGPAKKVQIRGIASEKKVTPMRRQNQPKTMADMLTSKAQMIHSQGLDLVQRGHHDKAIKLFDESIRMNPKSSNTWCLKGISLAELGQLQESMKCLDEAIRLDKNNAIAWRWKGHNLTKLERHKEAVVAYDKSISVNPDVLEVWRDRGISLQELGRIEEAIKSFEKALELNPEDKESLEERDNLRKKVAFDSIAGPRI